MTAPELSEALRELAGLAGSGRLDEAAARGAALLDRHAADHRLLSFMGMLQAQRGHPREAEQLLRASLQLNERDAGAWYNLGVLLQQCERAEEAAQAYGRACTLAPDGMPQARINMAHLLERQGRSEEALRLLDQAPKAQPEPSVARASLLVRLGRHEKALAQLAQAPGPLPPAGLLCRGIAHAALGHWDEAIAAYRQVLEREPGHGPALLNLGKALLKAGQVEAAVATFEQAAEALPDHSDSWSSLAIALGRLGRTEQAEQAIDRAIELTPEDANTRFNRAALLSRSRDPEKLRIARDEARRALELDPGHAAACDCLALVCHKLGEQEEALTASARALELDPEEPRYRVTRGDLLAAWGREADAVEVLRAGVQAHADHAELARQLGVACLRGGRAGEALEALDRSLALSPQDQRSIAHRAVALEQLGHYEEAVQWLGLDRHIQATELKPASPFEDLESFNRALAEDIRKHSLLRWEPVGLAARKGALTEDLTADQTPAIVEFERLLRGAIDDLRGSLKTAEDDPFLRWLPPDDYRINIWATLCGAGGNIDTHIHEESWLSGAYYVELPESLGADEEHPEGWIEFGRPHAELPFPEDAPLRLLRPREGLLLLFPSYLFHRTIPHHGEAERISISFDLLRRD